jgi:hypothetical protein
VLVESGSAAVQTVRVVVDRQLVGDAVEGEPAEGDPVRVPPGDTPEIRAPGLVIGQVVESERHIGALAAPVRHFDGLQDAAVRENAYPDLPGGQDVTVDGRAAGRRAPAGFPGDGRLAAGLGGGRTGHANPGDHEDDRSQPDHCPAG